MSTSVKTATNTSFCLAKVRESKALTRTGSSQGVWWYSIALLLSPLHSSLTNPASSLTAQNVNKKYKPIRRYKPESSQMKGPVWGSGRDLVHLKRKRQNWLNCYLLRHKASCHWKCKYSLVILNQLWCPLSSCIYRQSFMYSDWLH